MACLFRTIKTQLLEIRDPGAQWTESEGFLETPVGFLTGFSTLEEAMTSLEVIRSAHFQCFDYATQKVASITDEKRDLLTNRIKELAEALEDWSTNFDSLLYEHPDLKRSALVGDNPALLLLQIHRATLVITLSFSFASCDVSIDTFGPEFRTILSAAARIIDPSLSSPHHSPQDESKVEHAYSRRKEASSDVDLLLWRGAGSLICTPLSQNLGPIPTSEDDVHCTINNKEHTPSEVPPINSFSDALNLDSTPILKPTFSVGLGIIYPLFIVCAHCWDARLRLQAFHLLKICNRKEGIWDSQVTARVAEMVIILEEQETLKEFQRSGRPFNPLTTVASEVPDHARIRWLSVKFASETEAHIKYRMDRDKVPPGFPSIEQRTHLNILKW